MEIEYSLKPEDFKAFSRYQRKLRSVSLRDIIVVMITFVGIVLGLALWLPAFLFGNGALLTATLSVIIATWAGMHLHSQWMIRDVRVVLTANELRTVARGHTSTFEWSTVWCISKTDKHAFLYVAKDTAIIIPGRVFCDDQHFEEFVALARHYQQERGQHAPKSTAIMTALPPQSDSFTLSE